MRVAPGLLLLALLGCSDPQPVDNTPPKPCVVDADCAGRGYCTDAGICRRDCYVDEHCIGPGLGAQCNAQGKCISPVDAAAPPHDETGPGDAGGDEVAPPPLIDGAVEGGA